MTEPSNKPANLPVNPTDEPSEQTANLQFDPTDEPQLVHAPQCRNRRPPIIRLRWGMQPEAFCPECLRYGAVEPDKETP